MSGGFEALALEYGDIKKMVLATVHVGSENVNYQMEQYVWKRRVDGAGINIINLRRTWEKLLLAARAIVAIEDPSEVFAISSRPVGQRAVLKFAAHCWATPIAGRFTPGAFTNQIQAAFREPRLLIVTDPVTDHQPITEASYANIPVIAFCNTDSPLRFVDIAIPCNTKSPHSIGVMWWMLSREVLRLRGWVAREFDWNVAVDLFFYRDPEEVEKQEQAIKEIAPPPKEILPFLDNPSPAENWVEETVPALSPEPVPASAILAATADWAAQVQEEWAATALPPPSTEIWGGSSADDWS